MWSWALASCALQPPTTVSPCGEAWQERLSLPCPSVSSGAQEGTRSFRLRSLGHSKPVCICARYTFHACPLCGPFSRPPLSGNKRNTRNGKKTKKKIVVLKPPYPRIFFLRYPFSPIKHIMASLKGSLNHRIMSSLLISHNRISPQKVPHPSLPLFTHHGPHKMGTVLLCKPRGQ